MQAAIINILIQIVFFGFALWSIVITLLLIFIKNEKASFIKEIDTTAVSIIRYVGIAFICELAINVMLFFNDPDSQTFINRMFGKYWFGFWIYPFAYFFLPQLLWIKKIKANRFLRVIIAILIAYVLHIEKISIILTSLHRSEGSSISIIPYLKIMFVNGLIELGIFSALVLLIDFVIKALKKTKNSNV